MMYDNNNYDIFKEVFTKLRNFNIGNVDVRMSYGTKLRIFVREKKTWYQDHAT